MPNVNEEKQVAYYAIIPATIRYDERLTIWMSIEKMKKVKKYFK